MFYYHEKHDLTYKLIFIKIKIFIFYHEKQMIEGLKSYTLTELAKMDGIVYQTVAKRRHDYIPIQFENAQARTKFKRGEQKNPYTTRYIRRKDFEKYMKENGFEYFLLNK